MKTNTDNDWAKYMLEFLREKHTLFDKDILYIGCGALGISFSFIDKLVVIINAHDKFLLFISWGFFALSIFNCLYSTHKNIIRIREALELNNDGKETKKYIDDTNKIMQKFRLTSIKLIAAGVLFLIVFIGIN